MNPLTLFTAGFRTLTMAGLVGLVPMLMPLLNVDPVATFGVSPWAGAIIGAVFAGLRFITTTAVFQKEIPHA